MLANARLVHISSRQSAKRHACVRYRNFQSVQTVRRNHCGVRTPSSARSDCATSAKQAYMCL